MTKQEAIKYWQFRYDTSKDYYDEHWEGEERRAHREWVEAIKCALDALKEQEHVDTTDQEEVV